jgi:poly(3-hydroxybutyrate) depolymerase
MDPPPDPHSQPRPSGSTGVFAHTADPRFSFCLHVPPEDAGEPCGLVVTVHHSLRNFMECRDAFAGFGDRHRLVVLAPLFPINVFGDRSSDGYKYLQEREIRHDLLLNGMVQTVADWTGCDTARFFLQGYSGGAHFAQRYLLLHPQRVRAASIGAPGQVTLLDPDIPWHAGLQGVEERFGHAIDMTALRRVPLQMVVGDRDTETDELDQAPTDPDLCAAAKRSGRNRIERLQAMHRSWSAAGVDVQFELMTGVRHGVGSQPAIERAQCFFARCARGVHR